MQTENQIENTCKNCRYYAQHYVKRNAKYIMVFCGHCLKTTKSKSMFLKACHQWEEIVLVKDERKIKKTLENMSDRLDEIALYLKDDKDINSELL